MERQIEVFAEACNLGVLDPYLSFRIMNKKEAKNPCSLVRRYPGVYFLFDGDNLVYIGSSMFIEGRLYSHLKNRKMTFDSVLAVVFHQFGIAEYFIRNAEARCIQHFRPLYNRANNPDYERRGYGPYLLRQSVPKKELKEILNEEIQRV